MIDQVNIFISSFLAFPDFPIGWVVVILIDTQQPARFVLGVIRPVIFVEAGAPSAWLLATSDKDMLIGIRLNASRDCKQLVPIPRNRQTTETA
jgi:hypothetical protein